MRLIALSVVLVWASAVPGDPIWTETFDAGVGRFDQTMGRGDARFRWEEPGLIRARFVRDGANDRRYADLGETLDGTDDVLGFSFVVNTISATVGGFASSSIGFWNSADDNGHNRLGIDVGGDDPSGSQIRISGDYADGSPIEDSQNIEFGFFITYFIDVLIDGPSHTVSADVYQGTDATGEFLGSIIVPLDPNGTLQFDSLGMGGVDGNGEVIITVIDNFSFTVPEPTTATLLLLAASVALRRRRQAG